eukprot:CAMPEP_0184344424 /NCGR_PEP_ID=MMETSP1089-20130417/12936_1 /TAXON_ID=38269 ORGANISM="Gloeochaete wittrockiana, Strain SAG46.84" /NCGR_SAMPLE_ID=MMETSP1089 /ASSEMBLY_ACC=CAM_ASM_000445 /LENGTH=1007 /DNA_ID=CAMNT_0026674261 /DNA_START=18 /DNA_END=3041 /DNA_ORIENTATION=-
MESKYAAAIKVLLEDVKPSRQHESSIHEAVDLFKRYLESVTESDVSDVLYQDLFPPLHSSQNVKMRFLKPETVHVIGSYLLHTSIKEALEVDFAVVMPRGCFYQRDHLNYKYFDKRSLYLREVWRQLSAADRYAFVRIDALGGDFSKPILVIKPSTSQVIPEGLSFRIFAVGPDLLFPHKSIMPHRNNVRDNEAAENEKHLSPTPHYNSLLAEDLSLVRQAHLIRDRLASASLQDTVSIMKLWAQYRGLDAAEDHFSGCLFGFIVVHLVNLGRLTERMDVYHAFRVVLDFIGRPEFLANGIAINVSNSAQPSDVELQSYRRFQEVVIYDMDCAVNIAFRVSLSAVKELQEEARRSLHLLNDSSIDGISFLFNSKLYPCAKFDMFARVVKNDQQSKPVRWPIGKGGHAPEGIIKRRFLAELATKSLGDRANLVRLINRPKAQMHGNEFACVLGILLNSETARRTVEYGPPSDNLEESKKFREFWGEKAELRRFKNGAILETVVWGSDVGSKDLIPAQIVSYAFRRHSGFPSSSISTVLSQLRTSLQVAGKQLPNSFPSIQQAFDQLSSHVRSVEDLPLVVNMLSPASSCFSHTDSFPPQPVPETSVQKGTLCVPVLDVVMQFESSSEWPGTLEAIHNSKAALLLALSGSLRNTLDIHSLAHSSFLEVFFKGFVFRIHLYVERERHLLSQNDPKAALDYDRQLKVRPIHRSHIQALQLKYAAFSPSVRLAKRWLDCHLFSGRVSDEVVELLVAHVFLHPATHNVPASEVSGFLGFLRLLSTYRWDQTPLVLHIDGSAPPSDGSAPKAFAGQKKRGPGRPSMILITSMDPTGELWTSQGPSLPVLKRITTFAERCYHVAIDRLIPSAVTESEWMVLFRTPHDGFQFAIDLVPSSVHNLEYFLDNDLTAQEPEHISSFELHCVHSSEDVLHNLLPGFQPVELYVKDLEHRFGKSALFMYDKHGRPEVLVALKTPTLKRKREDSVHKPVMQMLHDMVLQTGEGFARGFRKLH